MGAGMHKDRTLAARQHGVISRAQLLALGRTKHQIEHRVAKGELVRVVPGVFRVAGSSPTERQHLWAASLWAGPNATLSHRSAGALWRLEGIRSTQPELWTPRMLRSNTIVVHRGTISSRDRGKLDGLPITSASLTLLDLAGCVDDFALEVAIEDARRRRLVTDGRILDDLARLGGRGRAGTRALTTAMRRLESTGPAESVLEVRVIRILRDGGVPDPVRQHVVLIDGRRLRIDLAWPDVKVGIECEGYAVHGQRRAFAPDRSRLADVVSHGWRIIPVTWEQTEAPARLVSTVRRTLLEAA